jgi:mono/diheme cytochrome c family protein
MSIATLRGRTRPLNRIVRVVVLSIAVLFTTACHLDMYQQPKAKPLSSSDFFANGSSVRPLLPNTVARNQDAPDERTTGRVDGTGEYITDIPLQVTPELIERGRQRYVIYCSACHGNNGNGKGSVSGLLKPSPPSFYDQNIVDMTNGYYFQVISNGKGAMYQYRSRIQDPDDRWAIIAYLREAQKDPPETPAP